MVTHGAWLVAHGGWLVTNGGWLVTIFIAIPSVSPSNPVLLLVFVALQFCRLWVISSLGPYWTTRIISAPDFPRVVRGPYRWVKHPNYIVVTAEIAVLPIAFLAWENANSSVKTKCETSVWSWLPLYVHGLGYWPKIRSSLRIWFIIILRFLHFFQKTAVLGLFFSFFGSQNLAKAKYRGQPLNPCFYCATSQKTDLRFQFLSKFSFFSSLNLKLAKMANLANFKGTLT